MYKSIKKRKKNKDDEKYWYIVVNFEDGTRKTYSPYKILYNKKGRATEEEADRARDKLMADFLYGKFVSPSLMTFIDFEKEFFENYGPSLAKSTQYNYKEQLKINIIPEIGHYKIQSINTKTLQKLINKKSKTLSKKTIEYIIGILRAMFRKAVAWDYIKNNPALDIDIPKYKKTPKSEQIKYWRKGEVNTFLEYIKNDRYYCLFFLAIYTGMRKGEILGLTWDKINWENNTITIDKSYVKNGSKCEFSDLKNSSSYRTIPVNQIVIDELKKHKKKQDEFIKKKGIQNKNNNVFINWRGDPLHSDSVYKKFTRWVKGLNVNYISMHELRHTHATLMLESSQSEKTFKIISQRLGHSSTRVTVETYIHTPKEMELDAIENFDNLLRKGN